jgi:hypothetical protein
MQNVGQNVTNQNDALAMVGQVLPLQNGVPPTLLQACHFSLTLQVCVMWVYDVM